MRSHKSGALRTVDAARRASYSVQQVRNIERDGVLPPAKRTDTGYRRYHETHVRSALAYRALAAATGPVEAKIEPPVGQSRSAQGHSKNGSATSQVSP